jgi:hypothetical protein
VGPEVGNVEVYKVHHHGSATSTNDNWLNAVTAEVGVISVGDGNSYGHPTSAALSRLHAHSVHTYWTETGAGVAPDPTWDKVGGDIVVQAQPGMGDSYTVAGTGFTDTYYNGGTPPPIHESQAPSAITLLKGSITVGDVTRLAADDASRVSIAAGIESKKYVTDWYGSVTLAHPPLNLGITYDGNYTVSRTQTLHLWNWSTSAWVQIDSYSVGTSDVTRTWSTTSPANYVSASREVRLRVRSNTRSGSFTCRGDYMAFSYDHAQGTAAALVAYDNSARPVPSEDLTGADEIALALAPNPAFRSTRFSFTLSREADVRLEVFDLSGRRVATPFAGRAAPGPTSVDWTFTRGDGSPLPAGIYFARLEGLGTATIARMVVLGR